MLYSITLTGRPTFVVEAKHRTEAAELATQITGIRTSPVWDVSHYEQAPNVTANLTDEELFDLIFGSGFDQYQWYIDPVFDWGTFEASFEVEDPDGGRARSVYFTPAVTRRAVNEAAEKGYRALVNVDWSDPDLDADAADVVIQHAVFGELVYG